MKKRLLAILLSAAMVITLLPSYVFAEENITAAAEDTEIFEATDQEDPISDIETEEEAILPQEVVFEGENEEAADPEGEDAFEIEETEDDAVPVPPEEEGSEEKAEIEAAKVFEDAKEICVGEPATAEILDINDSAYFRFVPEKTGDYKFRSLADYSITGHLYNSDGEWLTLNCGDDNNNDEDLNCVLRYRMTAGETYYFQVEPSEFSEDFTGSFDVILKSMEEDIYSGIETDAYIEDKGDYVIFRFVPEDTREYRFKTLADCITYGNLLDSDMEVIASDYGSYYHDDCNCMLRCRLSAGETYYFEVAADVEFTGYFGVLVSCSEKDLEPGKKTEAYIEEESGYALFRFVPKETGEYVFRSLGGDDTYAELLDAGFNCLAFNASAGEYDESFALAYTLTAGETYYYKAYLDWGIGSFPVVLTAQNHFFAWVDKEGYGQENTIDYHYIQPNESRELSVAVSADITDGITYQWYKDGEEISGANECTFNTGSIDYRTEYFCRVTDIYGTEIDVRFIIIIDNDFYAYASDSEEGDSWWTVKTALGTPAILSVTARGDYLDKVSYEWYGEDEEPEGTGSVFETPVITEPRDYYCKVYDGYGNETEVYFSIRIENHLEAYAEGTSKTTKNVFVDSGQNARLAVSATADTEEGISYIWQEYHYYDDYYDEEEDESYWDEYVWITVGDTNEYTAKNITENTSYCCSVKDIYQNTVTVYFNVYVNDKIPEITTGKNIKVVSDKPDEEKLFSFTPSATDTYRLILNKQETCAQLYDSELNSLQYINGLWSDYMEMDLEAGKTYYIGARNDDWTTGTFTFIVYPYTDNSLSAWYESNGNKYYHPDIYVVPGGGAKLEVKVSADDTSGMTYRWYENGWEMPYETASSVIVTGIYSCEFYTCEVRDKYKNSFSVEFSVYALGQASPGDGQASPGDGQASPGDGAVMPVTDISKAKVSIPDQQYTGSAIKPNAKVTINDVPLRKNIDYTISFSNNKALGKAKYVVKGTGDYYTGQKSGTFKIVARKITPKITLSKTSYIYDGKAKKPTVTVKDGSKKLAASNYTVSYASGRKNPGTYKVTVTMKGNYSGKGTASFTIVPKGTKLKKLTTKSKSITVTWTAQKTQTSGYEIQYSTNKNFKSGSKTVTVKSNKTTKTTIKKLTKGKTYYVRIRTFKTVNKKKVYSAWSAKKSIKVK